MHCLLMLMLLWEAPGDRAYAALREGRLDEAVRWFRAAVAEAPRAAALRKDYAYTLLKTGEREAAREQLEEAVRLWPADEAGALELAYLRYETGQRPEARAEFRRLALEARAVGMREKAGVAFAKVDEALKAGLERWEEALRRAPGQWSAHEELARLAEERGEAARAAEHFEKAWRLRPGKAELLVDVARTRRAAGQEWMEALAGAARLGPPRVVETVREMLGGELPGEGVTGLRAEAVVVLDEGSPFAAREMGERSLAASYLGDALRYFSQAAKQAPEDGQTAYQLGVTLNLLKRDREAVRWFQRAAKSGDGEAARQGREAVERLKPSLERVRWTAWAMPFYSSRWQDGFLYGQVRAERKTAGRVQPYVSLRLVGDTRGKGEELGVPRYLSETHVVAALGAGMKVAPRVYAWAEAGEAFSYAGRRADFGLARPDYRGGASWLRGWGHLLGGEKGWFAETGLDGVYVSRFGHDVLVTSQTRAGYTLGKTARGWQWQPAWIGQVTVDRARVYWANVVETGAGVRVKAPGLPSGMTVRAELVRGAHLKNEGNPRGPNFWDARVGVSYVFVH